MNALQTALEYHERTKHHPRRYARSPGYLDWKNQPDPFRRYLDAPLFLLPFRGTPEDTAYESVFRPGAAPARPLNAESLGGFLLHALGLSAWKEYGDARWELRCNPSSGNLHPTEAYVVHGGIEKLPAGIYHYAPREHGLELRGELSREACARLFAERANTTFYVGLTSVFWRETWKYGERAYRYCNLDTGHAMAGVALAAAMQGWRVCALEGMGSGEIGRLLGVDRTAEFTAGEVEYPEVMLAVGPMEHRGTEPALIEWGPGEPAEGIAWRGHANRLSPSHVAWDVIDDVAAACCKPPTAPGPYPPLSFSNEPAEEEKTGARAAALFQQRRSAVDMDGETGIPGERFFALLQRVMPRADRVPWFGMPGMAEVHLAIFAHRVDGLESGLYLLVRNPAHETLLREALSPDFLWERPAGCPEALPCHLLARGDFRETSAAVSCDQAIAGDGAFSLGMMARFEPLLTEAGAWRYPRLYWEAGIIGQLLYLEAEAAGLRGTGIGCFFDDAVHQVLGLHSRAFQSLYHFTIGGAVEDPRLRTLAPYSAERMARGREWG